ncbi:hypothetical protein [Endozoicomonas sp. ONNA2]|nr:hypothetical protein [Endozoicomonas sp. ONNA2]
MFAVHSNLDKELESFMALIGETEVSNPGTHNLIIPGHFSL